MTYAITVLKTKNQDDEIFNNIAAAYQPSAKHWNELGQISPIK